MAPSNEKPALGLGVKLTYGIGSVSYGVAGQALSTSIVTLYLNQVLGLPAALVGVAIMVSLIIDAFVDPLVGQWSDRTRSRWGRRHPFMYVAAPCCAVAFYFLWHAPGDWSSNQLFVFMLVMMVVVRLSLALYEIPSSALTPELAPDYNDRTTLIAYRQFFGILGAAAMYILLYLVFLRKDATHPLGVLNKAGYATWGAIAAVVMFVAILVSSLATHHLIPTLKPPPPRPANPRATLKEILTLLTNPSLVVLMVSGLLGGVAVGVTATLGNYFSLHFWGLAPQTLAILIVFLIPSGLLGTVIAPLMSNRIGKKRTMLTILVVTLITSVVPVSLRLVGWMPPNGSFALLVVLFADMTVSATLTVMGLVMVPSMIADVAEDNAVRSGVRSEGLLFAANGLLPKCTTGIGAFAGTLLLELAHFPAHAQQGTVDPAVLRHLALLYLPVLAVMNILSIAVLGLFYKLDHAAHERNLAQLSEAEAANLELVNEAIQDAAITTRVS